MAAINYDAALARVLGHEGGYSNHPSDPGGPTNWGITLADYARFKGRKVTAAEVRAMPLSDAKAIYRTRYWNALRCDELPAGLDYAVFDYGVNSGVSRAAKVLQRLLGRAATGAIDTALIGAIHDASAAGLITRLCDERLAFLRSLKTWPVFGAGWGRRVAEVRRDALAMAAGAPVPPGAIQRSRGKARVPAPSAARAATAAGTVLAGTAAAHAAQQGGASVAVVIAIVAATAVLAPAAWWAWSYWRKRKQEAPVHAVNGAP